MKSWHKWHHFPCLQFKLGKLSLLFSQDWPATVVLIGKTGKESLKRRVMEFKVNNLKLDLATSAKAIYSKYNLAEVRDGSSGAAAFYLWVSVYNRFRCTNLAPEPSYQRQHKWSIPLCVGNSMMSTSSKVVEQAIESKNEKFDSLVMVNSSANLTHRFIYIALDSD